MGIGVKSRGLTTLGAKTRVPDWQKVTGARLENREDQEGLGGPTCLESVQVHCKEKLRHRD